MASPELTTIQIFASWALPVLFAITVHEAAHGFVANALGDRTAKILGRLSLNPIKHIDLLGTIIIPGLLLLLGSGFIIGWAKPVPISERNLKNPRRDMAIIAIAGPLSNFIMAFLWALIAKGGVFLHAHGMEAATAIYYMGIAGIQINILLAVFNMLPIPPLDGGHLLMMVLPEKWALQLRRITPFGFFFLLLLLYLGLFEYVLLPIISYIYYFITFLLGIGF
jgi:Zn-dependent protease